MGRGKEAGEEDPFPDPHPAHPEAGDLGPIQKGLEEDQGGGEGPGPVLLQAGKLPPGLEGEGQDLL